MKLSQQIANAAYPVTGRLSERLNADLAQATDPITSKPNQIIQQLLDCSVPNKSNQHIFDQAKNYITQNS